MRTKEKGDLALASAIQYFVTCGYEVCLPLGDKRDWDLIVEIDDKLFKVQVKYAGIYSRGNKCRVGLRITGGNQSFHSSKKYSENAFDMLYIYSEKGNRYCIPWNDVTNRNELTVDDKRYQQYLV